MTHHSEGHYAGKHKDGRKADPLIADAIRAEAKKGNLSCAAAHKLTARLNTTPEEIGFHMDVTETRITKCQMGLFGYEPKKKIVEPAASVSRELREALSGSAGRLACSEAWRIADRLRMSRLDVSSACEALGIKISPCQLGAF